MKTIVLKPRMSEKTYGMSPNGVYVFVVETGVNKHEIAKAVEDTYGVTVVDVRTATQKGKVKRQYRNRRFVTGQRSDIKKAYVTLKEGDQIPIFAAVEEAEEKAEKTAKAVEKAAEKKAKKEEKKGSK